MSAKIYKKLKKKFEFFNHQNIKKIIKVLIIKILKKILKFQLIKKIPDSKTEEDMLVTLGSTYSIS
jgi:hypothetical protein